MVKGNVGEWSEFYVFLKLLADKKLVAADSDLNKITATSYSIVEIIRRETSGEMKYEFIEGNKIKITHVGAETITVEGGDLAAKAKEILEFIEKDKDESAFAVPGAAELMYRLHTNRLSASGGGKADLYLKVHDATAQSDFEIGFSIKSMLGAASTLLNASAATNFIYPITGLDREKADVINAIDTRSKIKDRLAAISEKGGVIGEPKAESETFEKNLRKIEAILPGIVGKLVLDYYSGAGSSVKELVENLGSSEIDLFGFELSIDDYIFKIKNFLYDIALGLKPSELWDGLIRAHGGYIIVRKDGEVVAYHAENADQLKTYLFENTKLETPSSSRHGFGEIYEENGAFFIKLNLQIRFLR